MLYLPSYRVQSIGSPPIESNKLFAVENGLLPLNEGVPLHGCGIGSPKSLLSSLKIFLKEG